MSEFDKEAEREKLRKQFEADEADREETERMSELLLGGATMTNKHCENCGNPLFRQNGHTFCPTCQQPAGATAADAADAADMADPGQAAEPARTPDEGTPTPDSSAVDSRPDPSVSTPEPAGDLAEARAGLVRTITRFVRRAEGTDDARRARELLSTAREAAETLDAVDRVRPRND